MYMQASACETDRSGWAMGEQGWKGPDASSRLEEGDAVTRPPHEEV